VTTPETNVQQALNAIAAVSSDDQTDAEVLLAIPSNYDNDVTTPETNVQQALNAIAAVSSDDQTDNEVLL
ncbi:hypothetical protein, partial [uncultured Maribacter sp.]|uniref:hypothetical protein n=1 Tax=uncultured Maribacter sp. TaxID=431308 RepID=UPI00261F8953